MATSTQVKSVPSEPKEMPRADPPKELSVQDAPERVEEVDTEPQFYVHLSDGSVMRCKGDDLPLGSGTNAPNGHWQRGNKVYLVIGVYPVEDTVEER